MKNKLSFHITVPCIIIPSKTGIKYDNQTGGYAVHELEVEGYLIPLDHYYYQKLKKGMKHNWKENPHWNRWSLQEYFDGLFAPLKRRTKYHGHGYRGIDSDDVKYIENALPDKEDFSVRVDPKRLKECEEAKIFVIVSLGKKKLKGILSWKNSD